MNAIDDRQGGTVQRWLVARSARWWGAATVAMALAAGVGGALVGTLGGPAEPTRNVVASGHIETLNAQIFASTSGTVRSLLVADGQDVTANQVIGWIESAVGGELVPLVAPLPGRVVGLSANQGEFLGMGTPVADVHQLGALYVSLEVDETDIDAVSPGQPIEVTLTALGQRFPTTVERVIRVPITEGVRSRDEPTYEVRSAHFEAPDRATVGMVVDARITVGEATP